MRKELPLLATSRLQGELPVRKIMHNPFFATSTVIRIMKGYIPIGVRKEIIASFGASCLELDLTSTDMVTNPHFPESARVGRTEVRTVEGMRKVNIFGIVSPHPVHTKRRHTISSHICRMAYD